MYWLLIILGCNTCLLQVTSSQRFECPDNAMHYDLKPCDPHERNQCPVNFVCRRSRTSPNNQAVHLCCASQKMTIGTWLEELDLSPQIIPHVPLATLGYVRVNDYDMDAPSAKIGIADELQLLDYPNYLTANIKQIKFESNAPAPGGYLHVLCLIDAGQTSHAIFINYDYPSSGSDTLLLNSNSADRRRFFGRVSQGSVAQQDTYRAQYVVLVYKTQQPLATQANISADMVNYIDEVSYYVSSSDSGRALGTSIAGTLFYVTTQRSMFSIRAQVMPDKRAKSQNCGLKHATGMTTRLLLCITASILLLHCFL